MFDFIEYQSSPGTERPREITVYALSTCGFCKRALAFLDANNIAYRYVYMDKLDFDVKEKIKAALRERFNEHVSFPYAVIDERETLVGFIEPDWRKKALGDPK